MFDTDGRRKGFDQSAYVVLWWAGLEETLSRSREIEGIRIKRDGHVDGHRDGRTNERMED